MSSSNLENPIFENYSILSGSNKDEVAKDIKKKLSALNDIVIDFPNDENISEATRKMFLEFKKIINEGERGSILALFADLEATLYASRKGLCDSINNSMSIEIKTMLKALVNYAAKQDKKIELHIMSISYCSPKLVYEIIEITGQEAVYQTNQDLSGNNQIERYTKEDCIDTDGCIKNADIIEVDYANIDNIDNIKSQITEKKRDKKDDKDTNLKELCSNFKNVKFLSSGRLIKQHATVFLSRFLEELYPDKKFIDQVFLIDNDIEYFYLGSNTNSAEKIVFCNCNQQHSISFDSLTQEVLDNITDGVDRTNKEKLTKEIECSFLDNGHVSQQQSGDVNFFGLGVGLSDGNLTEYLRLYVDSIQSQLETDDEILKKYNNLEKDNKKEPLIIHQYFIKQSSLRQQLKMINRFVNLMSEKEVQEDLVLRDKLIKDFFRIFPVRVLEDKKQTEKDKRILNITKEEYLEFLSLRYLRRLKGDKKVEEPENSNKNPQSFDFANFGKFRPEFYKKSEPDRLPSRFNGLVEVYSGDKKNSSDVATEEIPEIINNEKKEPEEEKKASKESGNLRTSNNLFTSVYFDQNDNLDGKIIEEGSKHNVLGDKHTLSHQNALSSQENESLRRQPSINLDDNIMPVQTVNKNPEQQSSGWKKAWRTIKGWFSCCKSDTRLNTDFTENNFYR